MTNAETARAMRGENTAESQLVEKVNKPTKSVPAASTEAFEQVEDRSSLTLPFKRTNREGFGPVHKPLVTHSLKSWPLKIIVIGNCISKLNKTNYRGSLSSPKVSQQSCETKVVRCNMASRLKDLKLQKPKVKNPQAYTYKCSKRLIDSRQKRTKRLFKSHRASEQETTKGDRNKQNKNK